MDNPVEEFGAAPFPDATHVITSYSIHYTKLYEERLKLMEMVLSTITLFEADQIAIMHVSEGMLATSGATLQDVEGFIDFPRSLRSVKVAVLIKEGGDGYIAASLRAKGQCDVAEIAKQFRITSYNVCYTKLLRVQIGCASSGAFATRCR